MKQVTKALPINKITAWVCVDENAALGLVKANVLYLTRLPDGFCVDKQFDTPKYRKVVKKAKAKFGVGSVVLRPDVIITCVDNKLEEFKFVDGGARGVTLPEFVC